ncbi:MAG: hypothetical protein H5U14_03730, partial [Roseovarius sp.]|nr:hypothetical protein [Roseovarius sp.]
EELSSEGAPQVALTPPLDAEPEVVPEVVPEVAAETAPDPAPEPQDEAVVETPPQPEELTPDELMARYAATGIWPLAPEPPAQADTTDIDEFYLTSLDEAVNFQDAVALPPAPESALDRRPETPPAPAPPGTQFTLDARGLVLATPEGALTPDGVLVRSGPPPVRPPETRPTPPAEAAPAPSAETTAEDARLGGIRPRTRPENLIEQQERGALSGLTRSELASLRPRLRPQAVIEAAAAAAAPPPAPEVQPADVSSASLAAALIEANRGSVAESLPQAVGTSIKPKLRPQDLEQAARAPQPDRATPGEDEEPEIQTAAAARVAPNIPTTASVARSATETNAINLRNVNLIGVYGSPQSRRALVRLSNGRYQKVQVGDRLDGGQVSAIGDAELRYNKRGRDVVLRMPKG